jgi:protein gp37
MNKQLKTKGGIVVGRGIEWCTHTWNPVGGCKHGCRWLMPDGTWAICYADSTAKTMTTAYPHGFEHHYWRPHKLEEPTSLREPAKIFMDSMSDLMGNWVPEEQIKRVFDTCRKADWHVFQLLTKNAPRLANFDIPKNVWVGVSAPPTVMFGKELTPEQQTSMVRKQLNTLYDLSNPVRWMSIEPLSFDIAEVFKEWKQIAEDDLPLEWAVIGAASNGPKYFQPNPLHVGKLHQVLRDNGVAIFHKGNLDWDPHLEEFPL